MLLRASITSGIASDEEDGDARHYQTLVYVNVHLVELAERNGIAVAESAKLGGSSQ
jgi:hypothetical protein